MSPAGRRDLVIIGGGAAGLVVASVAAQLGLAVTLIERGERLGGDCLHTGCVPSKSLLHAARVAYTVRHAAGAGLEAALSPVDLGRVMDRVHAVIDRIQEHDDPERFRGYGCEVLLGEAARFVSPHEVEVGGRRIRGRRFVIATGSRPVVPPVPGLEAAAPLTNENVFALRELPRRLVVLGAGPVGLELGQAFARLGSRVTVIERLEGLLPQGEPALAAALRQRLEAEGMVFLTGTTVESVTPGADGQVVLCSDGRTIEADRILVAAGRRPDVAGLGLDAAGVAAGPHGIRVDRRLRTTQRHIYACGDVCGPYAFTHMAEYQAGIVIGNAVFRLPRRADYRVVPQVIYTDPEYAQVGLTEHQARARGLDPVVLEFSFSGIDRALTDDESWGGMRLITRRGHILGASLLGPRAGELIHEVALAMKAGATVGDLSATIHAYPTLAQIHRRTANTFYAGKLFSPATRRLVKWLNRLLP